jgi:aminocarboxymuconate-semialdehyde decarboxylase
MAETIDAFAHILPEEFYEEMDDAHPTDALHNLYFEPLWDVETRLADMDEHGIDRQVLTLARPTMWRGIDPADATVADRYDSRNDRNINALSR